MKSAGPLVLSMALATMPLLARAQDVATPASQPSPASVIDPARLGAARQTIDYVFPVGTYARIMNKSMNAMMGPMMDGVGGMPISSLAGMGGATAEDVARLGKGTLADMMSILDPAYRQRLQVTSQVMTAEMTGALAEVEPGMRDALSRAYARRFSLAQLGELNRFFTTPTGRAYASESMTIMTDPDMIAQMQAFVPVLLKRMPDVMTKVQAATASLPKPRKYEELTPAEQQRFQSLLGTTPAPTATSE